jgi:hypothetical protein
VSPGIRLDGAIEAGGVETVPVEAEAVEVALPRQVQEEILGDAGPLVVLDLVLLVYVADAGAGGRHHLDDQTGRSSLTTS